MQIGPPAVIRTTTSRGSAGYDSPRLARMAPQQPRLAASPGPPSARGHSAILLLTGESTSPMMLDTLRGNTNPNSRPTAHLPHLSVDGCAANMGSACSPVSAGQVE